MQIRMTLSMRNGWKMLHHPKARRHRFQNIILIRI
jgi:hypothetical protein